MSRLLFLLVVISCTATGVILASDVLSQNLRKVNVTLGQQVKKQEKLGDLFQELEQQTGFRFYYEQEVANLSNSGLAVGRKVNLYDLLELLSATFQLKITQNSNIIAVAKDPRQIAGRITGHITDNHGQPLSGANIRIVEVNRSVSADEQGNYTIGLQAGTYTVEASYVAHGTQRREVVVPENGQAVLDFSLTAGEEALDEVVVVGYGTQRKENLTGAVSSISSKRIAEGNFTNAATLMQGRFPGLQIVQNSGAPGAEGTNLRIRGYGTFSGAGVSPLVIIDGVAGGDINAINPENIESMSVLKDAASAAIYGARAANGVILIQTKTGKETDKLLFNYHGNTAIHQATQLPDLIWNSVEYMELWNEAIANFNSGGTPYTEEQINLYRNPSDPKQYPNVNWLDELIKPRSVNSHTITASGQSGTTNYYIALAYLNQPGTFKGYHMDRTNVQVNMDSKLNKYLEIGTKAAVIFKNRDYPSGDSNGDGVDPLLSTLAQRPTYAPQLPDGSGRYTLNAFPNEINNKNMLLVSTENLYNTTNREYQLQGYLKVNFNPYLNLMGTAAVSGSFDESKGMNDRTPLYSFTTGEEVGVFGNNNLTQSRSNYNQTTVNSYLNFDRAFDAHQVRLVAGSSLETYKQSVLGAARTEFVTSALEELDAGPLDNQTNYGNTQEWALLSYFGRASYNFDERYLLEVNARYDGSSRFAKENRWGFFPSFSAGWRLSNEAFFKADWVDELKLRGSWGKLGNQQISNYPYQALLSLAGSYPFTNTLSSGVRQTRLNNRDISWETTTITDFGLDATLFKGRLNIVFDYFNKRTTDILRNADIPLEVGLAAPLINDGIVENKGFELGINTRGRLVDELTFDLGAFVSTYRNKLVRYGSTTFGDSYINQEGHPLQTYYLWEVEGIFQSEDEIANSATQANQPKPGDLKYKDQNGDNVINSADRVYMDGKHPDFDYSLNFGLNYKNFSLSSLWYGLEGRKFYTGQWGFEPFRQGSPPPAEWRNRWTPENPSTTMPRIYPTGDKALSERSDFFLEDASYFRLRSLDLSYSVPARTIGKIGINSLVIYLSGQNLFTWSPFKKFDPERVDDSVRGGVRYPQNKVYTLGAKIQF
ncbi:SusC/RagA family TonB-linked outer membrane protein [Parapedobacter defluvii]|uniref:SusC/RagA family TonB-linked outer membrane protein n=1 Tax=Parapedobacter defluvii TaxID=2045106 RepID=A0ABQ1LKP5_9SPHI|nr:TonB-dependent receptor [Parapedobacter defluvii]GGC23639.1 SusC/RagA family TonB-linked outer membrane protein [Parapedobacter defluvii]